MSVIAAKVYPDRIVMAADSIVLYGQTKVKTSYSKLESINGMIVGSTGCVSEAGALHCYMATHRPLHATIKDVLDFFVEFSEWKNNKGFGATIDNAYLLAYRGHLYHITGLSVIEIDKFAADGAGMEYALGALYLGHTPLEAVRVSCDLCCYVSDPIIEYTQMKEENYAKAQ